MYLNRIFVAGNAAADPEIRDNNGRKSAAFRIGITEKYKDRSGELQEKTEWVNIIAWGKTAEVAERHVGKGTPVFVEGKLQNRQWVDSDGNKRYVCEVLASNIQVDRKRASRSADSQQDMPAFNDDLDF